MQVRLFVGQVANIVAEGFFNVAHGCVNRSFCFDCLFVATSFRIKRIWLKFKNFFFAFVVL